MKCAKCTNKLTKGVAVYSKVEYGQELCLRHQIQRLGFRKI
mgnify:CR=1 FL=1